MKVYEIEFGEHLKTMIKVDENNIVIEGAINGWGDNVPNHETKVQ